MNADYLYVILQTTLLEIGVFYILYTKSFFKKHSVKNLILVFLLTHFGNCITHPMVFFVFMGVKMTYMKSVIIAEVFAFSAEGFLHAYFGKIPWRIALLSSLTANLFSWQVAPMISYFLFF